MPEEDRQIFGEIWNIYNKYRWKILTEEDFVQLTAELGAFAELHQSSALAYRLAGATFDVFNDMYRNGNKPAIPDYIGRSDI